MDVKQRLDHILATTKQFGANDRVDESHQIAIILLVREIEELHRRLDGVSPPKQQRGKK